MEAEENEKLKDRHHDLHFHVCRSIRYHDRRRAFFDLMHRISSVLTVLLASSVFLDLLGKADDRPLWMTAIAFMAAILGAVDIIVGFSKSATLHHDFKRRFTELEIALSEMEPITDDALRKIQSERLRIEQDEPPVYRALNDLCHNEVVRALGVTDPKEFEVVKWYKSLTRHLWPWANINSVPEINSASEAPLPSKQS